MHFGENQLSRSLIGLSPLPTTHPLSLQPKWVRASTTSYCCFTLAMGRSLRFGSRTHHYTTHKARALTDCKRTVSGTISLPSRGTFHHSLTVLIRYRSLGSIQAYRVVPADSQQIPRARCYSGTAPQQATCFRLRGSHPLRQTIPGHFD